MINSVSLTGRLTKDPEIRYSPSGTCVGTFTLAVNKKFVPKDNPNAETADFIRCVGMGKTAELIGLYLFKGTLTGIEGHIQTRSFDDDEGKRVFLTEVFIDNLSFLEPKKDVPPPEPPPKYNKNDRYTQR